MATIDISTNLPAVVTITNVAKEVEAHDAGTKPNAEGKKVITATRTVQLYRVNQFKELQKGDVLKVTAETSEELAYYTSLANEDLKVDVAKVVVA